MLEKEWNKFAGWNVIGHFLSIPNSRTHIKGLSKKLWISPNTAQRYMNLYKNAGVLKSENVANSMQFSLNNKDFLVLGIKRMWILMQLKESGFSEKMEGKNPFMSTLVLFGAFAKGDFTDHSDVDILVISQSGIDDSPVKDMEKRLGRQADLTKVFRQNGANDETKKPFFALGSKGPRYSVGESEHFLSRAKGNMRQKYFDVALLMAYNSMIQFVKKEFASDEKISDLVNALDSYRLVRHAIQYNGEACDEDDAKSIINDAENFLDAVRKFLKVIK